MTFRTALSISIVLMTFAGVAYIFGFRWAGYGFAFLNVPVWLYWLRTKVK